MKHPEKAPIHLVTIQMVVKDHQDLGMIPMILQKEKVLKVVLVEALVTLVMIMPLAKVNMIQMIPTLLDMTLMLHQEKVPNLILRAANHLDLIQMIQVQH